MPYDRYGIVVYAFGVPHNIGPNVRLADMACVVAKEYNAPIFTQHDIQPTCEDVNITYLEDEDPNNPPPTLRIARAAVRWADEQGMNNLIAVCADPHARRCMRDTYMAIREYGAAIKLHAALQAHEYNTPGYNAWFTPESTQPRTQSLEAWRSRERILDIMPFWVYKLVAS